MKHLLFIGALLASSGTCLQANPWDQVPETVPYKNLADAVKATSEPGKPSQLNPTCEGMTGDACVRSAEARSQKPVQVPASSEPGSKVDHPRQPHKN